MRTFPNPNSSLPPSKLKGLKGKGSRGPVNLVDRVESSLSFGGHHFLDLPVGFGLLVWVEGLVFLPALALPLHQCSSGASITHRPWPMAHHRETETGEQERETRD